MGYLNFPKQQGLIARWILLFSILTTAVPFSANGTTPLCEQFLDSAGTSHSEALTAGEFQENQKKWDQYIEDTVSPYYRKRWEAYLNSSLKFWILAAKKENLTEIRLLEKFGFTITKEKIEVPSFVEFAKNYENYLDAEKIPEDERIRPAITFMKRADHSTRLLKTIEDRSQNEKFEEWISPTDVRLTGRQMANALESGKYPVFVEGTHDLYHLTIFAMYPDYAKALRDGFRKLGEGRVGGAFLKRTSYFLEVLTLADPAQLDGIKAILSVKAPSSSTTYKDFLEAVNKLSESELNEKQNFLLTHFEGFLRHYAAGTADPYERDRYRQAFNILDQFKLQKTPTGKVRFQDLLTDGMTHLPSVLKALWIIGKGPAELETLTRVQVARMEYALWKSATTITMTQWAKDTLQPEIDINSPTMKFIKDVFGENSATYRAFTEN